jgi:hypothetical protein
MTSATMQDTAPTPADLASDCRNCDRHLEPWRIIARSSLATAVYACPCGRTWVQHWADDDTPEGAAALAAEVSDDAAWTALFKGSGRATLAEIADSIGRPVHEAVKALAELSAAGIVRLTFGGCRRIRGFRSNGGHLEIVDGEDSYAVLFAELPWEPLGDDRRRQLDAFIASCGDRLTLGSVALVCAGARVGHLREGEPGLSFTSDEIEDYLGLRRGAMR